MVNRLRLTKAVAEMAHNAFCYILIIIGLPGCSTNDDKTHQQCSRALNLNIKHNNTHEFSILQDIPVRIQLKNVFARIV